MEEYISNYSTCKSKDSLKLFKKILCIHKMLYQGCRLENH